MSTQDALDLAIQHHQAGRLRDAEDIYRQLIAGDPNNPHALHLLGVLFSQSGRNDQAIEFLRRAIAQNPTAAQYQCNLGAAFISSGRYEEAIDTYQRVLVLQPDVPDAQANLGLAYTKLGKFSRAIECLEAALKAKPNDFKILSSLGSALSQEGRQEEAIEILKRAWALRSDYAPTHSTLGNALLRLGRSDEAIAAYRTALALRPDFPEVLYNLAGLLCEKGSTDEAIELARKSLALMPNAAGTLYVLGRALQKQHRLDEACESLRKCLSLDPKYYLAHNGLGNVLLELNRHEEAIVAFAKVIELCPSGEASYNLGSALWQAGRCEDAIKDLKSAEEQGFKDPRVYNNLGAVHHQLGRLEEAAEFFKKSVTAGNGFPLGRFNLSMIQLLTGDFSEGWAGYEERWVARSIPTPPRYARYGLWDGSDVRGKRILLDCEQGLGDSIQFARYIPLLAERGAIPILAGQPELRRLLKTVPGLDRMVSPPEEIPNFDVQCPLLSLGRLFKTTLETIPARTPYVFADLAASDAWSKRIGRKDQLKIGLCWSGSSKNPRDRERSIPPDLLAPLAEVPNTWFCSLQKSPAGNPPDSLKMSDWTTELVDFADTAALVANLDLVISCDTSVAHLAGAMGKPVWLVIPIVPDWRWLLKRDDSPWYPTMRLFRQTTSGDWRGPIRKVVQALAKFDRAKS
jgi:tetratricopeptide (TPR) repeat protein